MTNWWLGFVDWQLANRFLGAVTSDARWLVAVAGSAWVHARRSLAASEAGFCPLFLIEIDQGPRKELSDTKLM